MAESTNGTEKKGVAKSTVVAMIVGAIIIVALVAVIIVLMTGRKEDAKKEVAEDSGPRGVVMTEDNVGEVAQEFMEEVPSDIPKTYTVTQNSEWEFEDGKSESKNAYVENDKENETPVYFDVIVDETGETVYSSPVLELGAKIDHIKLDKELSKGDYNCTVTYHLVDDKQNTLTTVSVGVVLKVVN